MLFRSFSMAVYKIKSRGFNEKGKPIERSEYIDSSKNILFRSAKNSQQVARNYNAFWAGEAKVVDVKKVKIKSRGENFGIKIKKLRKMM